jgi:uncharacterized membrane protein
MGKRLNLSRSMSVRVILFFSALLWCAGFLLPAILDDPLSLSVINPFLNLLYSKVCHQSELKSIHINGAALLICARCSGIYIGALSASILLIFQFRTAMNKLTPLLIASLLLLADVLLSTIGVYAYQKSIALTTGIIFGSIVFLYISNEIENFLLTKSAKLHG